MRVGVRRRTWTCGEAPWANVNKGIMGILVESGHVGRNRHAGIWCQRGSGPGDAEV